MKKVAIVFIVFSISNISFSIVEFDTPNPNNPSGLWLIDYTISDNGGIYVDPDVGDIGGTQVEITTGGQVKLVSADNNSKITVSGGVINSYFGILGNCQASISSGSIGGDILMQDNAQLIYSGGTTGGNIEGGNGKITFSGGSIGGIFAPGKEAIISGGDIYYGIQSGGILTVEGGHIGSISNSFHGFGITYMTGGEIGGEINFLNDAQMIMSGGSFIGNERLSLYNNSQLTLEGTDFVVNGSIVLQNRSIRNYAIEGIDIYGRECLIANVAGTLSDNTAFDRTFYLYDEGDIVVVPEPASLSLLAIGGLLLRKRKA